MKTTIQMNKVVAPAVLLFAVVVLALAMQARSAMAAGAVAMQVERIVKLAIMGYNSAMRSGDESQWLKYFTDNVKRQAPTGSQSGMKEFTDYYNWEFENFNASLATKQMIISGPVGAVEFEWDAVHKASGKQVKIDMIAVFELASSGKFESVRFYFDPAGNAGLFAGAPGAKQTVEQ
jgi:SnoaL-like domain